MHADLAALRPEEFVLKYAVELAARDEDASLHWADFAADLRADERLCG